MKTHQPVYAIYAFSNNGDFNAIHSVHTDEDKAEKESIRLEKLGAFGALEVVRFSLPLPDGSPIKKPNIVLA